MKQWKTCVTCVSNSSVKQWNETMKWSGSETKKKRTVKKRTVTMGLLWYKHIYTKCPNIGTLFWATVAIPYISAEIYFILG